MHGRIRFGYVVEYFCAEVSGPSEMPRFVQELIVLAFLRKSN